MGSNIDIFGALYYAIIDNTPYYSWQNSVSQFLGLKLNALGMEVKNWPNKYSLLNS